MKKAVGLALAVLIAFSFLIVLPSNRANASGNVPQAVLDLRKSVVRVFCQGDKESWAGSGFAIGNDIPVQYVITNMHVVEGNPDGVFIVRPDNKQIEAKVDLQLANLDLCVLKLEDPMYDTPPVELYDEMLPDVGQAVYALGFPGGADDLTGKFALSADDVTVTDGIISANTTKTLHEGDTPFKLLQINVAINHGNSGGPLVNEQGQVIGINTWGAANAQNINGAVSILELVDALRNNGVAYKSSVKADTAPGNSTVFGIAVVAAAGILVVVLIVLFFNIIKKRKKETPPVTLPEYLKQWGGRLPYDVAIHVLAPVVRELSKLHSSGLCHADICPENIAVNNNQAHLMEPGKAKGNRVLLHPGFSSAEQYLVVGKIGPWSDTYSICAVLYYCVTGAAPMGVLERQALGDNGNMSFGSAFVQEAHAPVILSGLSLDPAARPQNAVELISLLGLDFTGDSQNANPQAGAEAYFANIVKPAGQKRGSHRRGLVVAFSVILALCLGAASYYFYTDYKYNQGVACISRQDYKGGIDNLSSVLRVFKDADIWMKYASYGNELNNQQFYDARIGFIKLGDFSDSKNMVREVSYQEAKYLVTKGEFIQASKVFYSLGDYKDSKDMIPESAYLMAQSLINKNQYDEAIEIFKLLEQKKYKDAASMVMEANYQKAAYFLVQKNYAEAEKGFSELTRLGYKDSATMLNETEYQIGISLYNDKKLDEALSRFKTLAKYKESEKYIGLVADSIFDKAVEYYRKKIYWSAQTEFAKINKYKDCSKYDLLILCHYCDIYNYKNASQLYKKLIALGPFEDSASLMESDVFIYFMLEANWHDGNGSTFSMKYSSKSKSWTPVTNLPGDRGKTYKISASTLITGDYSHGWTKQYKLHFVSGDKLEVYCYKNKKTYVLTK